MDKERVLASPILGSVRSLPIEGASNHNHPSSSHRSRSPLRSVASESRHDCPEPEPGSRRSRSQRSRSPRRSNPRRSRQRCSSPRRSSSRHCRQRRSSPRRSRQRCSSPRRSSSRHSRQRRSSPRRSRQRCSSPRRSSSRRSSPRRSRRRCSSPRRSNASGLQHDPNRGTTGNATASNGGGSDFNILVQALKSLVPGHDSIGSFNNTIPEFDPARKEQTMGMWLHKVNECAAIYSWSQKQIVHYALPKLQGIAKRWYEGLPTMLFSWDEWQTKLISAFPSEENYGQMLSDMLAKRARYGDSLEEYFYEKITLINRCSITEKRAVECVLHGIDDRAVRLGAEAAQYEDLDKLLTYLRNSRSLKHNTDRKPNNKNQPVTNSSDNKVKNPNGKALRCNNCRQEGHFVGQCTQPIKKCTKCLRIGHEAENCYSKIIPTQKSINRVGIDRTVSDKYFKTVRINNIVMNSFVDLGSECSMLKQSELYKLGNISVNTRDLPVLRGFGNSVVHTLGRVNTLIEIDGVKAEVELLIVPDSVMQVPVMIGQTFTEQPHIMIEKTSENFQILPNHIDNNDYQSQKFKIHNFEHSQLIGLTILEVYTQPKFSGDLYIEGGLRNRNNSFHYVLTGIYQFNKDGFGLIVVNNLDSKPQYLEKDTVIARGIIANKEIEKQVMHIDSQLHDQQMSPICSSNLNISGKLDQTVVDDLLTLLNKYRNCFAFTLSELGHSSVSEMSIDLHCDKPVVYRPYRLAMKEKEIVRDMVDELVQNNIVRPSVSPFASPIVLVRKKTGNYRLCIDYRALNKNTIRENYPMPLIDDQIDALAGNIYFTALDLASGYYQISIREQDRYKTAFVTPEGHFEFNRMPFGLANAPATFQRIMHQVLGKLRHKEALAYLDDIIIPSKTIEEGMKQLESVLVLLSEAGLTLNLSKCVFFGRSVTYLGFNISSEGIQPGSAKIEAVEKFPVPINQHNVRQFLGLASFFRRFIQGFSIIAKPLTQLLKKNAVWLWGSDQQNAFDTLKTSLVQKPILALYNPNSVTELHTDACKIGIGGILFQRNEQDVLKPVAYYSKQTSPEEQNYCSYDLETLAVVASLQKFRVYLVGIHFKIVTDCNSLRATFMKRDMIPRVARWWTQMQEFDFEIEYKAGSSMAHVDALSRNPCINSNDSEKMINSVTETDWLSTVQNSDSEIQRIIGILSNSEFNDILEIKENYKIKNGKLFRVTPDGDRWVVPKGVRWQIVKQNHDDIGHFALDKTLEKIKTHYWFPDMRSFVTKYVSSCLECAYSKTPGGKRPGFLHPIHKVDVPFDTIHMDHVGPFVRSRRGNVYILVLIDAFTKYIYLRPVKNTKSNTTIKILHEFISIFGVPKRIISDRGTSFTSDLFKRFILDKGIKHVLNAVATPRANGQVERYNKVIVDSLTAKCVSTSESKWDDHLPDVQWGINNTLNKGINKTPAEALFGIRPQGSSDSKVISAIDDDVTSINKSLEEIRSEISSHIDSTQAAQKVAFDKSRCQSINYNVGDLVRVERQIPSTGGSKKLIPKYQGPYKITHVLDHDRYQVEDTPLTRKGNKKYSNIIAVDKLKPWICFKRPHDEVLLDGQDSGK